MSHQGRWQRVVWALAAVLLLAWALLHVDGLPQPHVHPYDEESIPCLSYSNWCGLKHGGFDDCCGGQPCKSCNSSITQPTTECLTECPPLDQLDHVCALHDSCTTNHQQPPDLPCTSFVNCPCDCALVKRLNDVTCEKAKNPFECDVCRNFYAWLEGSFAYCWIDEPQRECLPVHRYCNLTFVLDSDAPPVQVAC